MRPSHVPLITMIVLVLLASCLTAQASLTTATPQTIRNIDAAEAAGILTRDDAALNRIYHIFDPSRVDPRFLVPDETPGKSATPIIASILNDAELSGEVRSALLGFLDAPLRSRLEFISPSGIFKLTYTTTGPDAVPTDDDNGNGVPDFVEWCADYLDTSWQVEITDLGFMAPDLVSGYYPVSFESMGYYGYCAPYGGSTRIALHNNYLGFPPNDDPEGNQKGAAKATCAHEFKHASQYTNNGWSEGGWVEVDATWVEDVVFPLVNDYHNFVNVPGSPLNNPEQSLDEGGTGSYDDCLWQTYMSGTWSNQVIVDLWDLRRLYPSWPMLRSYDETLIGYGSSVGDVMAAWTRWNFLTGGRGVEGYGYDDALLLNTCQTWVTTSGLGTPQTSSVPHLAARYALHYDVSSLPDYPKVIFDGANDVDFRPQIIVKKLDETLAFDVIEIDAAGDGEKTVGIPFSEIDEIGISIPNCEQTGPVMRFTYQLVSDPYTGADGAAALRKMKMHPSFPNPFNPATTIRFELAHELSVDLTVLTVDGRVVRHMYSGETFGAGEHDVPFDGRDDSGDELPGGVYFARLNVGGPESELSKMVLVR